MTKYLKTGFLIAISTFLISCKEEKQRDNSNITESNVEISNDQSTGIWPKGEKGSEEFFTGNAYNYGLVAPDSIYSTLVGNVYFEPGARSNWHTHPAGQILIITEGVGYHQIEGQPLEILHKGDVVKCPPNVRHWHGASHDTALHQMYIVPNIEKGIVEWMEPVTDDVYNATNN